MGPDEAGRSSIPLVRVVDGAGMDVVFLTRAVAAASDPATSANDPKPACRNASLTTRQIVTLLSQ
jgi:hypothetical protein